MTIGVVPNKKRREDLSSIFQLARRHLLAVILVSVSGLASLPASAGASTTTHRTQHYIVHQTASTADQTAVAGLGYNLLDYSTQSVMDAGPAGTTGIFWVGNYINSACGWQAGVSDNTTVSAIVNKVKNDAHFSHIYNIADEPHAYQCPTAPQQLTDRTSLIKSLDPQAKTYATIVYSATDNEYAQFANSLDYVGADPYPCSQTGGGAYVSTCNFTSLVTKIQQAVNAVGTPKLVPMFQATGEDPGAAVCKGVLTDLNPFYVLPTVSQENTILADWDQYDPPLKRPFDATYEWKTGWNSCPELVYADGSVASSMAGYSYPNLQATFKIYFANMAWSQTSNPVADSYVNVNNPSSNYGAQTTASTTGGVSTILMKFTVSGIGSSGTVKAATLTLPVNNGSGGTANVYAVSDQTWTETGVTWNNQPAAGSQVATIPATTTGSTVTVNLPGLITGNGTYTIAIKETNLTDSLLLNTRENANPPTLEVNAVG